jgi:hypothetical protein
VVRAAGSMGTTAQSRALLDRPATNERLSSAGLVNEAFGAASRRAVGGNTVDESVPRAEASSLRREGKKRRGQIRSRSVAAPETRDASKIEAVPLTPEDARCPVGRCSMGNLCAEEKGKISSLLQQVLALSEDTERAGQAAASSQKVTDDLTAKNAELVEEVQSLRGKLGHALELLRAYQKRMKEMQQALAKSDSALAAARGAVYHRSASASPPVAGVASTAMPEKHGEQRSDLSCAITELEESSAAICREVPPSLLASPLESPRASSNPASVDTQALASPRGQRVAPLDKAEQTPAPNKGPAPTPHALVEGSPESAEPTGLEPRSAAGLASASGAPPEELREKAKEARRERKRELRARVAAALTRWRLAGGTPPNLGVDSVGATQDHTDVPGQARAVSPSPPGANQAPEAKAVGGAPALSANPTYDEPGAGTRTGSGSGDLEDRASLPVLESDAALAAVQHLGQLSAPLTDSDEEDDSADGSSDDESPRGGPCASARAGSATVPCASSAAPQVAPMQSHATVKGSLPSSGNAEVEMTVHSTSRAAMEIMKPQRAQAAVARSPQWSRPLGKAPRLEVAGGKCAPAEDDYADQATDLRARECGIAPPNDAPPSATSSLPSAPPKAAWPDSSGEPPRQHWSGGEEMVAPRHNSSCSVTRQHDLLVREPATVRASGCSASSEAEGEVGAGVEVLLAAEQREGLSPGDIFYDPSLLDLVAALDEALEGSDGSAHSTGRSGSRRAAGEQAEKFLGARHGQVLDRCCRGSRSRLVLTRPTFSRPSTLLTHLTFFAAAGSQTCVAAIRQLDALHDEGGGAGQMRT